MEERNTGEADFISKCVVEDLVKNVINGINDSNARINDVQDKSAGAVTESLASALESLTEESAREILEEETSKSVLSDKTSTIIKEFMCNESKDKSKPVIDPEEDDQAEELSLQLEEDENDMYDVTDIVMDRPDLSSLVIDTQRSTSHNKNVRHLDEVTFSEDSSEDQNSLSIPWETINESRSNSPNLLPNRSENKQQQQLRSSAETEVATYEPPVKKIKQSLVMKEVVDEFALEDFASQILDEEEKEEEKNSNFREEKAQQQLLPQGNIPTNITNDDDNSTATLMNTKRGRRVKSKPIKKSVMESNKEEVAHEKRVEEGDTKRKENDDVAEDVNQIKEFLRAVTATRIVPIENALEGGGGCRPSQTQESPEMKQAAEKGQNADIIKLGLRGRNSKSISSERKLRRQTSNGGSAAVGITTTCNEKKSKPINVASTESSVSSNKKAKKGHQPAFDLKQNLVVSADIQEVKKSPAKPFYSPSRRVGGRRKKRKGKGSPSSKSNKKAKVHSSSNNQVQSNEDVLRQQKGELTQSTNSETAPPPPSFTPTPPAQKPKPNVFKPIQNWHKIVKISSDDPLSRSTVEQIFKNTIAPYVPHIPPGTSDRCIEALTEAELEQLSCPGCKDRFLLPTSFYQHIYRKSARITFQCAGCGDKVLDFYNRCHLRIHILSHLEVDGIQSVNLAGPQTIQVAPLEPSELNIGFIDSSYSSQIESLCQDYEIQQPQAIRCSECKLPAVDIQDHFLQTTSTTTTTTSSTSANGGGKKVTRSSLNIFKCDLCQMDLPNKCSLIAHQRIHQRMPRHICPECGENFQTWNRFKHHVQKTCYHDARVVAVECVLCKRKGLSNPYAKEDSLFAHFYDSHIRLYYKCTDCNRAFAEKTSIYAHRNELHGNNNGNEKAKGTEKKLLLNKNAAGNNNRKSRITLKQKEDEQQQQKSLQRGRRQSATMQSDFSVLYKAAFLKAPHRLFSTREALESRLTSLIKTWRREFKFTCFSCESLFDNVGDLRDHNTTWCQMQNTRKSSNFSSNNWGASASAKLFDRSYNHEATSNGAGGNRSADLLPDLTQNETYEKMNQHLANLEALSSSCPDCQKIGLDYRAHLVHHTKHGLTATSTSSDARSAKTCSTEIHQVESALPASPATSSPFTSSNLSLDLQNTSSSPVVRITRQRLEAAARPSSTEPTNLIANNSPTPFSSSNKTSKKAAAAEVKATAEANSSILEAAESKLGSAITVTPSPLATNTTTTPTTNRKIKKKKFKSDKQAAMALVEVLGIRQPQDRHLMKINKVHKKALSFGATAIPISPEKKAGGSDECRSFECGLCDFSSELRQKFSAHISLHNPEGHLQCQMCGMCFASEPSWKRHLFLLHRIKRPQPYDYCQALTTTTNLEEQQSLK